MRVALLNDDDDDLSAVRSSFGEANKKRSFHITRRERRLFSSPLFFPFFSRDDVNRWALRRLYSGGAAWNERRKHTSVKEEIREKSERERVFQSSPRNLFGVFCLKKKTQFYFYFIFFWTGRGLISTTLGFSKLAPNERLSTLSLSLRLQNQTNRSVT